MVTSRDFRLQIWYSGSPGGGLAMGLQTVHWMGVVTVTWRL